MKEKETGKTKMQQSSSGSVKKKDGSRKKVSKIARKVTKKGSTSISKMVVRRNYHPKYKLHCLVQDNDKEGLLKQIRKKPQQIDQPDDMGRTPLQIACLEGSLDIVNLLLQMHCDVDIRERQGWTALHYACACLNSNALKIVECLVKKGNAYVLAENNAGATPLHYLVLNDACEETALFLEILMLMISRGADVNSQDKNGETPLHQAALRGLEESVVMLINTQSVNLNLVDVDGETCLHFAARGGHLNTAKILLSMGVDFTISGLNGTCLEVAESEGQFQLMEFFREWEATHSPTSEPVVSNAHMASITFNTKLLEAAELVGIEPSVAIACLYQMQARGEPTDDLQALVAEVNKVKVQNRECTVCLTNPVNSLCLPCRHSATCLECAELVRKSSGICPICREEITDILQIYIS